MSEWTTHVVPETGQVYYYHPPTGTSTWAIPLMPGYGMPTPAEGAEGDGKDAAGDPEVYYPYGSYYPMPYYGGGMVAAGYRLPPPPMSPSALSAAAGGLGEAVSAKPVKPGPPFLLDRRRGPQGPDGCNLFIFHIPNSWTNSHLYSFFTPFGTIISARIMVERESGRSRGFGFVSYDDPVSAAAAIAAMNGFKCENKRLKVEYKKARAPRKGNAAAADDTTDCSAATGRRGRRSRRARKSADVDVADAADAADSDSEDPASDREERDDAKGAEDDSDVAAAGQTAEGDAALVDGLAKLTVESDEKSEAGGGGGSGSGGSD
eukprot:PLAT8328.2.p2 GENE.PLAT8328.2~~PLAT8328.2.p2  ORF type:complete len:320 (+),score=74.87 PLAT8328.2:64-1023(+)